MDKTRVGLVSFSDKATNEFDLGSFRRKEDLKQVQTNFKLYPVTFLNYSSSFMRLIPRLSPLICIKAIQMTPYKRGRTNLASAISTMRSMFTPQLDRADAPNFAILVSDGRATLQEDMVSENFGLIMLNCVQFYLL